MGCGASKKPVELEVAPEVEPEPEVEAVEEVVEEVVVIVEKPPSEASTAADEAELAKAPFAASRSLYVRAALKHPIVGPLLELNLRKIGRAWSELAANNGIGDHQDLERWCLLNPKDTTEYEWIIVVTPRMAFVEFLATYWKSTRYYYHPIEVTKYAADPGALYSGVVDENPGLTQRISADDEVDGEGRKLAGKGMRKKGALKGKKAGDLLKKKARGAMGLLKLGGAAMKAKMTQARSAGAGPGGAHLCMCGTNGSEPDLFEVEQWVARTLLEAWELFSPRTEEQLFQKEAHPLYRDQIRSLYQCLKQLNAGAQKDSSNPIPKNVMLDRDFIELIVRRNSENTPADMRENVDTYRALVLRAFAWQPAFGAEDAPIDTLTLIRLACVSSFDLALEKMMLQLKYHKWIIANTHKFFAPGFTIHDVINRARAFAGALADPRLRPDPMPLSQAAATLRLEGRRTAGVLPSTETTGAPNLDALREHSSMASLFAAPARLEDADANAAPEGIVPASEWTRQDMPEDPALERKLNYQFDLGVFTLWDACDAAYAILLLDDAERFSEFVLHTMMPEEEHAVALWTYIFCRVSLGVPGLPGK
ncbi:unnamed protein product [Amoebophrya sp. A25]|nr:unnamed protein product [Amoebophrya sp. A25]|eukprot:GSA25T00011423001.1